MTNLVTMIEKVIIPARAAPPAGNRVRPSDDMISKEEEDWSILNEKAVLLMLIVW